MDRRSRLAPPTPELRRIDVEFEPPLRDVEFDDVAGAHQPERTADRGLGRDVEYDRAAGGAAHPRV